MSDQQVKVLSLSMTEVEVRAGVQGSVFSGEQLSARLPVSPGIYTDQTDIILSNQHPSAELTVYGPAAALQQLDVCLRPCLKSEMCLTVVLLPLL